MSDKWTGKSRDEAFKRDRDKPDKPACLTKHGGFSLGTKYIHHQWVKNAEIYVPTPLKVWIELTISRLLILFPCSFPTSTQLL